MPKEIADYVHRIGRTGRCGKTGIATTFINKHSPEEVLLDLKYLLIEAKQRLPLVLQTITGPDDAIVEVRRVFASLSRQPLQLLLLVVMTTTSLTLFSLPHTHTHTHTRWRADNVDVRFAAVWVIASTSVRRWSRTRVNWVRTPIASFCANRINKRCVFFFVEMFF